MEIKFSTEIISRILEQSMLYQCACPAQVCKNINEQRALYVYQQNCINMTDTDRAVHKCIADAVMQSHAAMEACLEVVLRLEGWDLTTYEMPENLKKMLLKQFE
ncbi:hypothetical protein [Gallionella capsiferriformans]|jgi:hypothetical protein|uniref:Uncharacterized protein n=1 Tax=Gallionella capsiferriformans (strain ES-2) TaxID=395494 RepID=D9SHR8_GALCS|nr:hypothetical protein [Gallionella capsiferriformans]ADL54101.1 hypothetical protein Galf_0056 [Gallionella capsiferriformans ES-2]